MYFSGSKKSVDLRWVPQIAVILLEPGHVGVAPPWSLALGEARALSGDGLGGGVHFGRQFRAFVRQCAGAGHCEWDTQGNPVQAAAVAAP